MTIYIDVLFLENIILNCIILYVTAIISRSKIRHIRIICASAIGAMYVIIYYVFEIKMYTNIFAKLLLAICMVYIVFIPKKSKDLLKYLSLFFLISFVFGGATLGVIYIVNYNNITIQNGMILGKYTIKTIILGAIIAFFISILSFKLVKAKLNKTDMFCSIKIKLNQKQIETKAMIDTGNLLKEPISNIPVVVVEDTVLENILPKEVLENTEKILGGDLRKIPIDIQQKYISKLKVIPFSSLGKQNGMLLGIKAESIEIITDEGNRYIDKVIIGIYNKQLSKKGEYKALLGIELI